MRRLDINLLTAIMTFAIAVAADSFVNWLIAKTEKSVVEQHQLNGVESIEVPAVDPAPDEPSDQEYVFDHGRLRIVSEEIDLKSESLRYDIDVRYPQIIGSSDSHVRKLNQRIESSASQHYEWMLDPSKEDLSYYHERWPEVFNSVDLDYEVLVANDFVLSLYLNAHSYGIGAGTGAQASSVVNYDLRLKRELRLTDIFKPGSKYLEVVARYCQKELAKKAPHILNETVSPNTKNWNVTRDGIRFNFDECEELSCAEGEQSVVVPFAVLETFLNREFKNRVEQVRR